MVVASDSNLIYYSADPCAVDRKYDHFPTSFTNATYMINLAILKSYQNAGVTLCGKNLYGAPSDRNPDVELHESLPYVSWELNHYRAIVDLMGHRDLGGKTFLYLVDGLWGCKRHPDPVQPPVLWSMSPFNNDYPSSLFASQDPVAIDSVGLDFARTQWRQEWNPKCGNSVDDYMHEAALANNPPSGTFYGPDYPAGDPRRTRLQNLGVHEHWNDANDKLYTRNLGTGDGIELVSVYTWTCTELLAGDVTVDCKVDEEDLATMASNWLVPDANFNQGNLDGQGRVDFLDFDIMGDDWYKCNRSWPDL